MKTVNGRRSWARSQEGWLAGVCQGIAEQLDVQPGLVRLLWIGAVLFGGIGVFLYLVCAFVLPIQGREDLADQPRFLGVCHRLAHKMDVDLGLLRVIAVIIGVGSLGTTLLVYVLLHFLIPNADSMSKYQR